MNTNAVPNRAAPNTPARPAGCLLPTVLLALTLLAVMIGAWTVEKTHVGGWATKSVPGFTASRCAASRCPFIMDPNGQLWLGSMDGISVQNGAGGWKQYDSKSGLADDVVLSIAFDKQGRAWVGTQHGLSTLAADGKWTSYTTANSGLTGEDVRALATDGQGRVWAGTSAGLSMLAPDGSWASYTTENSPLPGNLISALATDSQGRVWIASNAGDHGGLFVAGPDGQLKAAPLDKRLAHSLTRVSMLAADPQGRIWAELYQDGNNILARIKPDGRQTAETLPDEIYNMAFDPQGQAWAGSSDGLYRMSLEGDSTAAYIPSNGGEIEGLVVDRQGLVWVDNSGELLTFDEPTGPTTPTANLLNGAKPFLPFMALGLFILLASIGFQLLQRRIIINGLVVTDDRFRVGAIGGVIFNIIIALVAFPGMFKLSPCYGLDCLAPFVLGIGATILVNGLAIAALLAARLRRMAAGFGAALVVMGLLIQAYLGTAGIR